MRCLKWAVAILAAFLTLGAAEANAEHLDHFLCYTIKASKGSPKFTPITGLSLDDQFEQGVFSVTSMSVLCVPAQKESEPLTNPDIHLMGYAIKASAVTSTGLPRTNRTVVNQLGALTVNVGATNRLLVPSLKSLTSDPGPPDPNSHDVDHFKCYAVTLSPGTPPFPKGIQKFVVDQFHQGKIYNVTAPARLCVPVDKAGEQIKKPQNELMCYAVAPAKGQPKHRKRSRIHVHNQFDHELLDTVKDVELCVPPGNAPPHAVDDAATTPENTPVNISILTNDTDPDGDPLTVTSFTQGGHGKVDCSATSCTYTPSLNFTGSDSFTYTISDGFGGTDTATVRVTVSDVVPPSVTVTPANGATTNDSPLFIVSYTDPGSSGINLASISFTVDSVVRTAATQTSTQSTYQLTGLAAGLHSVAARVSDIAGNTTTVFQSFTVVLPVASLRLTISVNVFSLPAGSMNNLTIQALDAMANTVTSFTGNVLVTTSDGLLPLNGLVVPFAAADLGQVTVPNVAVFSTLGNVTVTGTVSGGTATGSVSVNVVGVVSIAGGALTAVSGQTGTTPYSVSITPASATATLALTQGFALFGGGTATLSLGNGATFTLDGVAEGTDVLTVTVNGVVVLTQPVAVAAGGGPPPPPPPFVTTLQREPVQNPAMGCAGCYVGNGQTHLERVDLAVPGRGVSFAFKRTYKSNVQYNGPLGFGWQHNYDMRIRRVDASTLEWVTGTGRAETFAAQLDGSYAAPVGHFVKLLGSDPGFTIREPDGTRYAFNSLSDAFAPGYLRQVSDRHGNRLILQYGTSGTGNGKLVRVLDAYDRAYTLTYDAQGHMTSLQDFSGRTVGYHYSSSGDLNKVTSPVVLSTTTGGSLIPENQFPQGKSEIYAYSQGNADATQNHKMTLIVAPNEAAGVPDASLEDTAFLTPRARVENTWTTDPLSPNLGRLSSQRVGGTNAQGAAGGTYTLTYTPLTPTGVDPVNDEVMQTTVLDRAGNRKDYFTNVAGQCVRFDEYANRNVRPSGFGPGFDPPLFETQHRYNADGLRTSTMLPLFSQIVFAYDSSSPSRNSQANLLSRTQTPGFQGDSRGGMTPRVKTFRYEPVYNQVRATTDERGNDPSYTPQNDGPNSAARYTTTRFFDYQQTGTVSALSAETGLDTTTLTNLLATSGTALGQGDLNADPSDDAFTSGDVVKVQQPTVTLVATQTREIAALGGTQQAIVTLVSHNRYGQTTKTTDPEKNVSSFTYFASFDPDGDGKPVPGTTQTDTTGGYLASSSVDTVSAAGRDSGQNPPPANITTRVFYDTVGNVVRTLDARGIEHLADHNALNQVVRRVAASSTAGAYSARDLALPALGYETLTIVDANNNVTETRTGNQGERDGTGAFVPANLYWTTKHRFDILDRMVTTIQEVTPIADDGSITEISPGVVVTGFTRDANENVILVTKPELNTVATTYDERDLPFTVTRGFGTAQAATTRTYYDWNGNPEYLVDAVKNNPAKNPLFPDGDPMQLVYDGFDRQTGVIKPESERSDSVYDPAGKRVRSVSYGPMEEGAPRLAESSTLHDELGRPFQFNQNLITFGTFGIPFDRSIPTFTSNPPPAGDVFAVTLGEHDALGRTVRSTSWKGDETLSDYDGAGRLARSQSPIFFNSAGTASARNETQYGYDGASNTILTTRIDRSPAAGVATQTFQGDLVLDALGRVIRKSDSLNFTTRTFYDSRGNVVATTDAKSSSQIPDPLGLRAGNINNHGNVTRVFHDGLSRPVKTERLLKIGGVGDGDPNLTTNTSLDTTNPTTPSGIVTTQTFYDRNSRPVGSQDSNGNATSQAYDALDRPTTTTLADLTTAQTAYDADDHRTGTTDPNGTTIVRTYDGDGRLTNVNVTNRATNLAGTGQNVLGTTFQAFEWDGLSRLRAAIDDNGAAATKGVATNFTWNSLNQKTEEQHQINASVAANPVTTTTGRITVLSLPLTLDRTVTSGYTAPVLGQVMPVRTAIGYPSGPNPAPPNVLPLKIDGLNRTSTIFAFNSMFSIANYEWLGDDRPVHLDTPTEDTRWGYGPSSPFISKIDLTCKSGEDHFGVAYNYDNNYNRMSEQRRDLTLAGQPMNTFGNDSLNRGVGVNYGVVGMNPPTSTTNYGIDGAQNFATRVEGGVTTRFNSSSGSYVPNVLNEYTSIRTFDSGGALMSTDSPVHDAAGNQIQGGRRHVFFDAFNRVVRVDRSFDGTTYPNVGNYTYAADGRRVTKSANVYDGSGTLMRIDNLAFINDGFHEIEEVNSITGLTEKINIWGATEGAPLFRLNNPSGQIFQLQGDAQGSTMVLTDGFLGNPAERYKYNSIYGTVTVLDPGPTGGEGGPRTLANEVGNPFRFQGRRFDDESGLYYFHHRYLDPDNGRFLSRGPPSLGNRYAFADGNPFNAGGIGPYVPFIGRDEPGVSYTYFDPNVGQLVMQRTGGASIPIDSPGTTPATPPTTTEKPLASRAIGKPACTTPGTCAPKPCCGDNPMNLPTPDKAPLTPTRGEVRANSSAQLACSCLYTVYGYDVYGKVWRDYRRWYDIDEPDWLSAPSESEAEKWVAQKLQKNFREDSARLWQEGENYQCPPGCLKQVEFKTVPPSPVVCNGKDCFGRYQVNLTVTCE